MNEEETTAEELRELIRQGHMMVKDLIHEKKEIGRLMAELRSVIEEVKAAPLDHAVEQLQGVCDAHIKKVADETAATTNEVVEFITKTCYERFDLMMDILVGYDQGRRKSSIPDLLRQQTDPKIDLDKFDKILSPITRSEP